MEVEPAEVARLLKEKTIKLLDVRTAGEYQIAHIDGGVLVDQALVDEIVTTWPKDTEDCHIVPSRDPEPGCSGVSASARVYECAKHERRDRIVVCDRWTGKFRGINGTLHPARWRGPRSAVGRGFAYVRFLLPKGRGQR